MYRLIAFLSALFASAAAFAGVVGSGTPSSCTEAALAAQIAQGGTVTFDCGAGPQSITFTFTLIFQPTFPKVTVDGGGTITLDGTGLTNGMISVWGSEAGLADVTLKRLTIANGNITTGLNAGGAIQNFGRLTLDNVTLRNSHAAGAGAIFQEPCTGCLDPTLTATHSLFQNNSSGSGAISIQGGNASIEDSTFSGNSSPGAGAIDVFGNSDFKVDVSIDRCTFSGNSATKWGGGAIVVESLNPGSVVRITNDTFNGNSVAAGGFGSAIYVDAAPVTITNCTIAGNTAAAAGGGAVWFGRNTTMNNTIVAGNGGGNCSYSGGATFSGGHNLQFGDSTCSGVTVADPLLSALADNGGPSKTMALGAGSPAIDAADGALAPATDQRGYGRPDGKADIGAFERGGTPGSAPTSSKRHRAVRP